MHPAFIFKNNALSNEVLTKVNFALEGVQLKLKLKMKEKHNFYDLNISTSIQSHS